MFRVIVFSLMFSVAAVAAENPPAVEPKADAVLKQMSEALASAKRLTFEAHAMTEVVAENGQKIQLARNQKVAVRRPDGAAAVAVGDREDLQFIYDGTTVTLFNKLANAYGIVDAPKTIDETCDMLAAKYGMALPLADLLFSDPYKSMIGMVRSGAYLGTGFVFDAKCHHLAFRQEGVDWQIWIDAGEKPLPRKVVITYKETPGHLQYTAFLTKWDLAAQVPDSTFTFTPPADAKKVDFAQPEKKP